MSDSQTPTTTPLDSRVPALLSRSTWVFALVLFIQITAFYAFVAREIAGNYPFANDQAGYLAKSHQIFESMLSKGIFSSLLEGMTGQEPTGMLLPSEAAFLYLLFGVSRAAALSVNLIHWVILQVIVFATFSRLSRSAGWGYYAVGLLLLMASPFRLVGGMFDFRIDFSAACLIGIVCSLVIYMECSNDRRATWYVAAACCYAICMRHILLVLLGGTLGVFALILLIQHVRATSAQRLVLRVPLRNFLIPTLCLSASGLILLAVKYQAFYNYYVVGHLVGSEKEVRAAESGVDVIGRYAYYPLSVFQQHLGYPALSVLGAALVLLLIQAVLLRVGRTAGDAAPAEHPFGAAKLATAFTALVVLVTLAILTADTAKSPVVGSMLAVPLLLLFALLTTALVTMRNPVATWRWQPLFALVPLAVFALGTARTLQSYSGRTSLTVARAQFEQLPRAYRAIGDYLAMFEVGNPKFFSDRFTDYQAPSSFQVSYYEMTGRAFEPADPVGRNILLTDFKPFREFLPEADVAMITENSPASDATNPMPTARMFRDNAAEIRSIVSARMVKIDEVLINDHVVGVYVKPRTPVEGVSGGWITSGGIKIKVLRESLPGKQFLVMKGTTIFPEQLKGSLNGSAVDVGSGEKLPLKISLAGTSYVMEVDIRGHSFAPGKWVALELKFDRFFVPRKAGISADDRELVILAPSMIRLEQASALGSGR